ncbi:hypothetical protein [Maribacter sp. 2304DJ31-5]|uniref:hypothetical protein n=1 Tax=Maribacter sp. 2304DJ31-5 TaxID=3386273 RepID=UPI0039BCA036
MITFFTIFLVLIGVNAVMMIVSMRNVTKKTKQKVSEKSTSVIYPLDLSTPDYKKAV